MLSQIVRKKMPTFCSYRSKNSFSKQLALAHKVYLQKYGVLTICHENLQFALRYRFDGVHLTSAQLELIPKARRAGLLSIVSTHTLQELLLAKKLRADFATFSPIFSTPGKGAPTGTKILRQIWCKTHIPVIALGGIVSFRQIKKVKRRGAKGFASIRYFIA